MASRPRLPHLLQITTGRLAVIPRRIDPDGGASRDFGPAVKRRPALADGTTVTGDTRCGRFGLQACMQADTPRGRHVIRRGIVAYGCSVGSGAPGASSGMSESIVVALIAIWGAAGCWLIASAWWPGADGRK
jgi:hypothetical protein